MLIYVYTSDDLNWSNDNSRVSREHDNESLRDVKLKNTKVDNWEDYDTVLIGYPILGQSGKILEQIAGSGNWQDGQRFSSSASDSDIQKWTDSLK